MATGEHRILMDAVEEIRRHIQSRLDGFAADEMLLRVPARELCAALSTILHVGDEAAIGDACLVIRDCALLASSPGTEEFRAELSESEVIKHLEATLFADNHVTRARVVYALGKICSTESLPVLHKAFATYRDTDPLLVPGLVFESVWLGANEWDLLDRVVESPVYLTRWSIIDRLSGLDGAALNEKGYDRRKLRYLEALRFDENSHVRDEATYCFQALTTYIPRDLPRGERKRRRTALHALEPRITFMTCSIRFGNHLQQSGQQSYTVGQLEEFIDVLVATL